MTDDRLGRQPGIQILNEADFQVKTIQSPLKGSHLTSRN